MSKKFWFLTKMSFLKKIKREFNRDFYTVGEYFNGNVDSLLNYLDNDKEITSLFDVPLHFKFRDASNGHGDFDMRTIFQKHKYIRNQSYIISNFIIFFFTLSNLCIIIT